LPKDFAPRRSTFRVARGESNDPKFAAKAAGIAGLYMAPPESAIVLAAGEQPSIEETGLKPCFTGK
jgi:hypothetical protein